MSASRTLPAPPLDPNTGELISEQNARLIAMEKLLYEMKKAMVSGLGDIVMRMDHDAKERRELMDQMLDLVRSNRHRIEDLEAWRHDMEPAANGVVKQ